MENFFIIGAQRSGTTLLRLILNAHSQVAISEEGTFWMPLLRRYGKNPHQKFTEKEFKNSVKYISSNSQFKLWDIPSSEFIEKINFVSCPDLSSLMENVYSIYSAKYNKSVWADKTPSFFRMVPELSRIFETARFIHIIRDGRDLHLSWKKMDPSKSNIAVGALEWQHKVKCAQKDLLEFAKSKHLEIRYEDLVSKPDDMLKDICNFLKIKFEPEMLSYWQESRKFIGEHHSELIFKPLSTSSVNKWKRELSPVEVGVFESIAGGCLVQNNYSLSAKRKFWYFFVSFIKLAYGLPHRAGQIVFTMTRLWFSARFGTATTASGGK